jgi:hypothetical protein
MKTRFRGMMRYSTSASIAVLMLTITCSYVRAQDEHPSAFPLASGWDPPMHFKYARNLMVTQQFNTGAPSSVRIADTSYIFRSFEFDSIRIDYIDRNGNCDYYGNIKFSGTGSIRDISCAKYLDGSANIFIAFQSTATTHRIVSIPFTATNRAKILGAGGQGLESGFLENTDAATINLGKIEQISVVDNGLFLATDVDSLIYFDVSQKDLGPGRNKIVLSVNVPTMHSQPTELVKIHEVKGYKASNGQRIIGLGLLRYGMCVMTFPSNSWDTNSVTIRYQYYEHDRTLFPNTIINSYKYYYDPTFYADSNDIRNHK